VSRCSSKCSRCMYLGAGADGPEAQVVGPGCAETRSDVLRETSSDGRREYFEREAAELLAARPVVGEESVVGEAGLAVQGLAVGGEGEGGEEGAGGVGGG